MRRGLRPRATRSVTGLFLALLPALPLHGQGVHFPLFPQDRMVEALRAAPGDNAERKDAMLRLFREAGCDDLAEPNVKSSKQPNVVCTVAGGAPRTILVGAHYDRAKKGGGVADNWTGAVALAALRFTVAAAPRRHTFVFVGFTGEEKGSLGSKTYANALTKQEVAQTSAMLNIDTLGLSDTKIWWSRSDRRLGTLLVQTADALKLPISGVDIEKVGSTDSESFAQRKIPSLTVHSVTQDTLAILHTKRDRFEAVDIESFYRSYRLLAAYLVLLDQQLDAEDAPQRLEKLTLEKIVPLDAPLHHVQGIDVEGDTLWVSSVEAPARRGFLHRFHLPTGKPEAMVEVQDGDRFHPGGITLDGEAIWLPVAEYRRLSSTAMQRRDKRTLALLGSFAVPDHIGSVAAAPEALYGGNWDSLQLYTWSRDGRQLAKRDNPAANAYQDLKFVDGQIVGGGLRSREEGAIDWLDPETLALGRRIVTGKTERGVLYTHEGMTVRGGRLYLLPEDGPSRLFVYRLIP